MRERFCRMNDLSEHTLYEGLKDGIPIFLGYLSVSFGFGVLAVSKGLSTFAAVMISLTNVTSAGQLAGLEIVAAGGALIELICAECVINLRYALMSISLTQKLDSTMSVPRRLICGFAVTDEIFAVAYSKTGSVGVRYFYSLMSLPLLGWVMGTLAGALAGSLMPASVRVALGIMLYAMFIAIVLPPASKSRAVFTACAVSAGVSVLVAVLPALSFIDSGYRVVVSAVLGAAVSAALYPAEETE